MDNINYVNNNIELLSKLKSILPPLNEMATLSKKSEFYQRQLDNNKYRHLTKEKNIKEALILAIAVGCGLFVLIPKNFLQQKISTALLMSFLFTLVFVFVATIITFIIYYYNQESKRKRYDNLTTTANEQLSIINKRANELINQYGNVVQILPPDYQYFIAAEYIYSCFLNQRATNMAEAINLYEAQLHRWRMENYQKQLVNIQYQQQCSMEAVRRNTAIAAGASVVNAFGNLASHLR